MQNLDAICSVSVGCCTVVAVKRLNFVCKWWVNNVCYIIDRMCEHSLTCW